MALSDAAVDRLERLLREKVSQKTAAKSSDEVTLMRAFKFYDEDSTYMCDVNIFKQTMEKLGAALSYNEIEALFRKYNAHPSASLDYRVFIQGLLKKQTLQTLGSPTAANDFTRPVAASPTNRGYVPMVPVQPIASPTSQFNPRASFSPTASAVPVTPADVRVLEQKFRDALLKRGVTGIFSLGRMFRIMTNGGSRSLNKTDFKIACKEFNTDLSDREAEVLFGEFDRSRDGQMDYNEFLRGFRGPLNPARLVFVRAAFARLDVQKRGFIDVSDMRFLYDTRRHPEVRSGKKTGEQVLAEFLETFTMNRQIQNIDHESKVTFDEFAEYYANVSASIDDDSYFELMMTRAWKLDQADMQDHTAAAAKLEVGYAGNPSGSVATYAAVARAAGRVPPQPQVSPVRASRHGSLPRSSFLGAANSPFANELTEATAPGRPGKRALAHPRSSIPFGSATDNDGVEEPTSPQAVSNLDLQGILQRLRFSLEAKGLNTMTLLRHFKMNDQLKTQDISLNELSRALQCYDLKISQKEIDAIFLAMDHSRKKLIDYNELVAALRGGMCPARKAVVERAFRRMDRESKGYLTIAEIKDYYNTRRHPEVTAGRFSEATVLNEILAAFENCPNGEVSQQAFCDFYDVVSSHTESDEYFALLIDNVWRIPSRIQQLAAGGRLEEKIPQGTSLRYIHAPKDTLRPF
eukprot:GILJ01002416.1.p1 GENE.GILJ01002416.1~~GILJ01002416.1.p1  ORF type:complete len:691 (-),score=124.49 GILJ01002416.1:1155-3227(-)